jgi:hypothetical protein
MANLILKAKIVERFRIQGAAAKAWKMSESRLSHLVTGLSEPTQRERELFRRDLGLDVMGDDDGPKPAA